jgi:hypothetical protein
LALASPRQDDTLLAVKATTEDADWYDETVSGGLVVANDPMNATDPTGMEEYRQPISNFFRDQILEREDCDDACSERAQTANDIRDEMIFELSKTRLQSSALENAVADFTNVYEVALEEITEAATEYALTGNGGSWLDRADGFMEVVGKDALLNITASRGVSAAAAGSEIAIGNNLRIALFGNRTGHVTGRLPHYHRRVFKNKRRGKVKPGQGMGRHRPWDKKPEDKNFGDRF